MDLVVMAAGMGSRFGGLKQIQPIDDDNNFILDYSIYDAIRAGFDRVIFIIKEENYDIFTSTIGNRLGGKIKVEYAFQRLEDVPAGTTIPESRVKPWGTAHAIYATKDIVSDRFAIINADDFYGYESFKIVADFLKNCNDDEFVCAGFYVKNTLSSRGAVKRGLISAKDGLIQGMVESEVEYREDKMFATPLGKDEWREIPNNSLASMNMFGFTKKLMTKLETESQNFFAKSDLSKSEFLIPYVIDQMIKEKEAKVYLRETTSKWYGITYKEDLQELKTAISQMIADGKYPVHLYQ
ncbi:MAG: NDP-sugar synthase [Clostridia bacterium]